MRQRASPPGARHDDAASLARPQAWPALAHALGDWVPRQRWFQGKARVVTGMRVADTAVLAGPPQVLDIVLEVSYAGAERERYQVPLVASGSGDPADGPGPAATVDGLPLADALADPGACRALAASALRTSPVRTSGGGRVRGMPVTPGAVPPAGPVRPMGVEQTNSSVVVGGAVLKVFRRLEDGPNPDVELTRALTTTGFANVPAQRGSLVLEREGAESTLAVLSEFAAGGEEGWALACAEAVACRDAARGTATAARASGFAADIRDLGSVVGRLHATLAFTLGRHEAREGTAAAWAEEMRRQARQVLALARTRAAGDAAAVLAGADALERRFEALGVMREVGPLVRTHGDLHLGQVLRQGERWLVLDFEGEPARPLAERREPHSPLRDVAGMLRSFDYAAAQADLTVPPPLQDWRDRLREAFLDGYLAEARPAGLLPADEHARALLDAFELDKAVYELGYELANRPEWVAIPAGGILRVLDGR